MFFKHIKYIHEKNKSEKNDEKKILIISHGTLGKLITSKSLREKYAEDIHNTNITNNTESKDIENNNTSFSPEKFSSSYFSLSNTSKPSSPPETKLSDTFSFPPYKDNFSIACVPDDAKNLKNCEISEVDG